MSQEEKIKELELKIKEKDAELEKLYSVVGSLNSCLSGIIQDTEAGIRAATSLYRKFASKKLPKMKGFTFASKYMISKESLNSYFDLFQLPQDKGAGIIVCDAKGYGTSAVVMSIASSLAESDESLSCETFFETLDKELNNCANFPKTMDSNAVSLMYILIDKSSLEMELCSVGMPGMLIARNDELLSFGQGGTSMSKPKRESLRLIPGDRIIIVNNGLVLSENSEGRKFGLESVKKALSNAQHLPISDLVSGIGFELDLFTDGKRSRLKGDITVLGIEVERKLFYVV